MNHPHLHRGRGRVGPVIPGAAPMQHVPPMPGGNNSATSQSATSQDNEQQDDNTSSNQNQHDKFAQLPNAGPENLDLSDANKSRDTGIQGTGDSESSQPPRVGEPSEPVFFPHNGLDRTRPHNVPPASDPQSNDDDGSQGTNTDTGPVNVAEPSEPVAFPHVGLDRTRPGSRGVPFHSPDLTSSHTESSKSSNPSQDPRSNSATTSSETHYHVDTMAVISTKSALTKKLPPELIEPVLEYAEYFPSKIIGKREEEVACSSTDKKLYLVAHVPDFPAFDPSTEGAGGSGSKGRANRVRRLVFKVKSRDQGWSSNAGRGSFVGSYSWLEVELWRRKEVPHKSGADDQSSSDTHTHTNVEFVTNEYNRLTTETDTTHDTPTDDNGDDDDDENNGYERLGEPELLQRNRHADRNFNNYEIVWDWQKDQLPDSDPDKWEVNGEGWYKDGHTPNGAFVRRLRGGDEIRVILASQFPGWACRVASCEVEMFWAV